MAAATGLQALAAVLLLLVAAVPQAAAAGLTDKPLVLPGRVRPQVAAAAAARPEPIERFGYFSPATNPARKLFYWFFQVRFQSAVLWHCLAAMWTALAAAALPRGSTFIKDGHGLRRRNACMSLAGSESVLQVSSSQLEHTVCGTHRSLATPAWALQARSATTGAAINATTTPVIAWFNGGPGCSSLWGMFVGA